MLKAAIAGFALAIIESSLATDVPWDLGHFKNDTGAAVLVYLTNRPDHYYAVFGVGRGGTNIIDLRPDTTAIVTLVPPDKTAQAPLLPAGKQIAKSKLIVPGRRKHDRSDRHLLYIIRGGQVRFMPAPRSNQAMQLTALPYRVCLS